MEMLIQCMLVVRSTIHISTLPAMFAISQLETKYNCYKHGSCLCLFLVQLCKVNSLFVCSFMDVWVCVWVAQNTIAIYIKRQRAHKYNEKTKPPIWSHSMPFTFNCIVHSLYFARDGIGIQLEYQYFMHSVHIQVFICIVRAFFLFSFFKFCFVSNFLIISKWFH